MVESVATAMSATTHIIPSGSEKATQLTLGYLEALSSQGRLLRTALTHRGVGACLRVQDGRGCVCGGHTEPALPSWSYGGPSGPCRPASQTGYFNVLVRNSATVPANNVRESNLINLHFDICLRNVPGGKSGLSNRFL